jgi:hypothetical protein
MYFYLGHQILAGASPSAMSSSSAASICRGLGEAAKFGEACEDIPEVQHDRARPHAVERGLGPEPEGSADQADRLAVPLGILESLRLSDDLPEHSFSLHGAQEGL